MSSADFGNMSPKNCRTFKTKWWMASFYNMCLCLIEWFVECQGKAQTVSHNCWLLSALSALQRLSKTLPAIFCPSERDGGCYNIIKVFSIRELFFFINFSYILWNFRQKMFVCCRFLLPSRSDHKSIMQKRKTICCCHLLGQREKMTMLGVGGEMQFLRLFRLFHVKSVFSGSIFFSAKCQIVPKQRWRDRIVKSSSWGKMQCLSPIFGGKGLEQQKPDKIIMTVSLQTYRHLDPDTCTQKTKRYEKEKDKKRRRNTHTEILSYFYTVM